MPNIRLTDLPAFSGLEIQDTDVIWIDVDNGDTTFNSYQISGLQLRTLLVQNIYLSNGAIDEARVVTVDPATGSLQITSDDTAFNFQPAFINWLYQDGTPANDRQVILSVSSLGIYSKLVQYDMKRVYSTTHTTISDTPEIIGTYTPIEATVGFTVVAEVKGFCAGTNNAYFVRITQLYKLVAGVATAVGSPEVYEPTTAVGMDAVLIVSSATIQVQVTGVSAQICEWRAVVTVF